MFHTIIVPYRNKILTGAVVSAIAVIAVFILFFKFSDSDSGVRSRLMTCSRDFVEKYPGSESLSGEQKDILSAAESNMDNDSLFYVGLRHFGRKMFEFGDQVLAFEYLNDILAILSEENGGTEPMMAYKAYCYLLLGAATDEVGLASLSQGYYFSGMKLADQIGNDDIKGDFYNNLGVSLYKSGNPDKAKFFFDKSMVIAKSAGNGRLMYILHNNMAEICSNKSDYDLAIDHMLKAMQYVDVNKSPEDYYSLQSALGSLYLNKGENAMAYACLSNAYRNQDSTHNKGYLYDTSMLLSTYFSLMSQPDSVRKYLEVAWRMADVAKNPHHRILLLEKEAGIESEKGNHREAYLLEKQVRALKDSLHNEENIQRIEQAHNIYDIERKAYENMSGISRWNPVVVFVSMSCVVVLLMVLAVWIAVIKRKSDRINAERARTASDLAELHRRQLDEEKAMKQKADDDLRMYHQKLSLFTLERLKTNGTIEEVATEAKGALLRVSSRDKDLRDRLNDIILKLTMLLSDTQWDEFQYYFEKVHPDFYSTLDSVHPGLTAKDRRLCALVSLGLSTKDIAAITCLETRSVESSRNRLRKKLGLENDENLFEYIKRLSPSSHNRIREPEDDDGGMESEPPQS